MTQILLDLMAVSTLTCAFNAVFYLVFFLKAPGYGNALLTLYPLVYLVSSYLETNALEAQVHGDSFRAPAWVRLAVGVAMLGVALGQAVLAVAYYRGIITQIDNKVRE
jgi:hypothetical protein